MVELQITPLIKSGGCTPLMKALLDHDETMFTELLTPSTINAQNDRGWTALHIACINSSVRKLFPFVSILLSHGADPNIKDIDGWTALMFAARYSKKYSSEETVRFLLNHGADANLKNNDGWTALMIVVRYTNNDSSEETVRILLNHGGNPNLKKGNGWTALMLAARYSNKGSSKETVRILLNHGSDPTIKDDNGKDVIDETMSYVMELKITKLEAENKKLRDEIDLLYLNPLPGKQFINLFIEEFPKDENFAITFVEAYNPILIDNLTKMKQKC
jgi:ankyrin repeat protein